MDIKAVNELNDLWKARQQLDNSDFRYSPPVYNKTTIQQSLLNPYPADLQFDIPFFVTLTEEIASEEDPDFILEYKVRVSTGRVIVKDVAVGGGSSAIKEYECINLFADITLNEFPMQLDEAIYVEVKENSSGVVLSSSIRVVVDADDYVSVNYKPLVNLQGIYRYKLAVLKKQSADAEAIIEPCAMGSHIYHHSGLTKDIRFVDCQQYLDPAGTTPDPSFEHTQLARFTFIGGMLAGINISVDDRALDSAAVVVELPTCTSTAPASMV
jgi:hypothetical protein